MPSPSTTPQIVSCKDNNAALSTALSSQGFQHHPVFTETDVGQTLEIQDGKVVYMIDTTNGPVRNFLVVKWRNAPHRSGSSKIVFVQSKLNGTVRLADNTEFENLDTISCFFMPCTAPPIDDPQMAPPEIDPQMAPPGINISATVRQYCPETCGLCNASTEPASEGVPVAACLQSPALT